MTFTRSIIVAVAMLAAGCAASPAPSAPKAPDQSDKPTAAAPEEAKGESGQEKGPAAKGRTLADHEADYMSGCRRTPELGPYCDCAWKVFSGAYTVDQMNKEDITEAQLTELTSKTTKACGDKMPESELRAGFMKGCSKDNPEMKDYCECFWPELSSRFSRAELASSEIVGTPKHTEASKQALKKCGGKVPEPTVKKNFLKGCGRGDPQLDKLCECAWKETRTIMSPAEIQTTTDSNNPGLVKAKEKVAKNCSKFRPAQ